jgi:hypothetical protein
MTQETQPTFQIKRPYVRKLPRIGLPPPQSTNPIDELVGLVDGRNPGSKYEWYTALALWGAGIDFQYQVPVFGGKAVVGGQVIDFLVNTLPLPTPLFVDGQHWHEGQLAAQDLFKRDYLDWNKKGVWEPHQSLFGPQVSSKEAAVESIRRMFRGG